MAKPKLLDKAAYELGYADQKADRVKPSWYGKPGDQVALSYREGCREARRDAFYAGLPASPAEIAVADPEEQKPVLEPEVGQLDLF